MFWMKSNMTYLTFAQHIWHPVCTIFIAINCFHDVNNSLQNNTKSIYKKRQILKYWAKSLRTLGTEFISREFVFMFYSWAKYRSRLWHQSIDLNRWAFIHGKPSTRKLIRKKKQLAFIESRIKSRNFFYFTLSKHKQFHFENYKYIISSIRD